MDRTATVATDDLWTYTGEFRWLRAYIDNLKLEAITEMCHNKDMERYAELRGMVMACDFILQAPERYVEEMRKREARANVQEAV